MQVTTSCRHDHNSLILFSSVVVTEGHEQLIPFVSCNARGAPERRQNSAKLWSKRMSMKRLSRHTRPAHQLDLPVAVFIQMDHRQKGLRTGIVIRFEIKRRLQTLAQSKGFCNFLLARSLVAPAHRSTLLHLLNTINFATQCSVMLPPSVQSIIHTERRAVPAVAVRSGRSPVRARESKVRFADHPEVGS